MTRAGSGLFGLLGGLMLCTVAFGQDDAEEPSNPYQGIVDRNVFALKPPPEPPPSSDSLKPPMPKFYLTGITTMFREKRAMMKATPPAKPGEQAKEQSYFMAEGQREGELEVLEIDALARTVKVSYAGTTTVLDFTNNAAKAAPAPPPEPGAPGLPVPPGGAHPPAAPAGNPGFHSPNLPTRPLRPTGGAPMPNPGAVGAGFGASGMPYGGVGAAATQPAQGQAAASQMSREQQELLMEAMREQNKNNPEFPPLPPTSLSPLVQSANQEAASPGTAASAAVPSVQPVPPGFPPAPPRPF